jgi:hypothetical protein
VADGRIQVWTFALGGKLHIVVEASFKVIDCMFVEHHGGKGSELLSLFDVVDSLFDINAPGVSK